MRGLVPFPATWSGGPPSSPQVIDLRGRWAPLGKGVKTEVKALKCPATLPAPLPCPLYVLLYLRVHSPSTRNVMGRGLGRKIQGPEAPFYPHYPYH